MSLTLADISESAARARIERYLDCLGHWSSRINLTGAETAAEAFRLLVLPVLGSEVLLRGDVIDVGSGNGSPALVLATLRPDLSFTLLEPRAKRWAFLREAIREMGIDNATVRRERSDAYSGPPADTITMRAVGLDPRALRPMATTGGQVLIFGGPEIEGSERLALPAGSTVRRVCFT